VRSFLVRLNIRPERFPFRQLREKQLEIAYALKAPMEGATLRQLLRGRRASGLKSTADAIWTPVRGFSEEQVSVVLQRSLLFVFLSVHEGLGRLPVEAMASGCIVCGFDRGPMSEYLPAPYRFADGDILAMAKRIEDIVDAFPTGLSAFESVTAEARLVAETYNAEAQERTVLNAWERIVDSA
jgi:glycosyltransferase involved in cell wall biosynthesis